MSRKLIACVAAAIGALLAPVQPLCSAQTLGERPLFEQLSTYLQEKAAAQLEARQERVGRIETPGDARARQLEIKTAILELIGGLPQRTPLNARVVGVLDRDGYKVEKVVFESQPNFHVTANLYVPAAGKPPFPGILSPCGHSANGKASSTYQHVYISLAKKGFVVLSYDPIGQGERYQYYHPWKGKSLVGGSTSEHSMGFIQALPTGLSIARFRIWDGMRSLDYLISRPEVDASRIGITGNSGGGTMSAYLSAVDDRIAVSAPSCYLTSWGHLFTDPGPQDGEQNFVTALQRGLDHADFVNAFAPKPMLICAAVQDFFPIEGTRDLYKEARQFYGVLGVRDRVKLFEADDRHGFSLPRREAAYRWLRRWLQDADDDEGESPHQVESDWDLTCTNTGQVMSAFPGEENVASILTRERQALRYQIVPPKTSGELASLRERLALVIRQRLMIDEDRSLVRVTRTVEKAADKDEYLLQTEPGIEIPVIVFLPKRSSEGVVLYLSDRRKSGDYAGEADLAELTDAGYTVCALDPRGIGRSAPRAKRYYFEPYWQVGMKALLVGKTLVGMQVHDILATLDFLQTLPGNRDGRVRCVAKGFIGVAALHAAALDKRIDELILENSLLSYDAVARNPMSNDVFRILVPSALREYDLPVLAALIAPRRITFTNMLDQMRNPVPPWAVRQEYDFAGAAYRMLGVEGDFAVGFRAREMGFFEAHPGWKQPGIHIRAQRH